MTKCICLQTKNNESNWRKHAQGDCLLTTVGHEKQQNCNQMDFWQHFPSAMVTTVLQWWWLCAPQHDDAVFLYLVCSSSSSIGCYWYSKSVFSTMCICFCIYFILFQCLFQIANNLCFDARWEDDLNCKL